VCRLKWEYEVKVPELGTSVFIIPGERVKNGEERLVVLNRVARSVIEGVRGYASGICFRVQVEEGRSATASDEDEQHCVEISKRAGGEQVAGIEGRAGFPGLPAGAGSRPQAVTWFRRREA
jgi:hypothetical protein